MGYKVYGEDEPLRKRWKEYIEWFLIICIAFLTTIGGWFLFIGIPLIWLGIVTIFVAVIGAWNLSKI